MQSTSEQEWVLNRLPNFQYYLQMQYWSRRPWRNILRKLCIFSRLIRPSTPYAPRYCVTDSISQILSVPSKSLAKLPSTKEGQRSFGSQAHSCSTCLFAPDCLIGQQHDDSRRLRRHEGHSFAEIQREKRIILDESAWREDDDRPCPEQCRLCANWHNDDSARLFN